MNHKTNPFIISGTQVVDGNGKMLVLAVGVNKVAGMNEELMGEANSETPLQEQLTVVADKIGELGLMAAVFIGCVMIAKDIIILYRAGEPIFSMALLNSAISAFIICITVLVVAIPEGLPMAVTISLAYSVFKMKEENNLVKHLDASETMGNVNNICTDKTGTLTKGVMEVRNFYMDGKDNSKEAILPNDAGKLLVEAVSNNITSYAEKVDGKMVAKGNPTESAILQFLINRKEDYVALKHKEYTKQLPFSSVYKLMSTIVHKGNNNYRLYIKGAPERVLKYCSSIRLENGKIEEMNKNIQKIQDQQEKYAMKSFRTIAVGYKDFTANPEVFKQQENQEAFAFFESSFFQDITLIAMFGIADAPREDVFESIKKCNDAGIIVRMVTGDNIKTAISIAQDVGILTVSRSNNCKRKTKKS